jgi:hypothetical protein
LILREPSSSVLQSGIKHQQSGFIVPALAYVAITLVVASPLVDFRRLHDASYEGDARLLVWTLAWDAHALLTGTALFDANIYYPEARPLSYAEHHIGLGVFGVPLYAATANPVLTYWILWLLAFPLNALAMHALAWRITRDRVAALAAGCVYAFCFFRMHHAHGHIQLLWTWMLPLVPLALDEWLERPSLSRAFLLTALVMAAALTSGYLAVFVALLGAASAAWLIPGRHLRADHVWQALLGGALAALTIGWFARPYLALTPGPVQEAAANAADLRSYLVPATNTVFGQLLERFTPLRTRWIWGEQTLYAGISVLTLGLAGAVFLRQYVRERRAARMAAAVLAAGVIGLALSFGPASTSLSPFDLLSRVPGLGLIRAPARFALLVMLAASLLAGIGALGLCQRFATAGRFAVAILMALFFVESFVVAFPAGKPRSFDVPDVYRRLAMQPPGPVVSLPTYRGTPEAFRESDYLLFSTAHWFPIVNGFGRQEPPDHGSRLDVLATFPSPESLVLMQRLGVRYVVLHTRRASGLKARAESAAGQRTGGNAVRLLHSADGDYLFEVR